MKCPECNGTGIISTPYLEGIVTNNYVCPTCEGSKEIPDTFKEIDESFCPPGYIYYTILEDGSCSYCDHQANKKELLDGTVEQADYCTYCDRDNEELRIRNYNLFD